MARSRRVPPPLLTTGAQLLVGPSIIRPLTKECDRCRRVPVLTTAGAFLLVTRRVTGGAEELGGIVVGPSVELSRLLMLRTDACRDRVRELLP